MRCDGRSRCHASLLLAGLSLLAASCASDTAHLLDEQADPDSRVRRMDVTVLDLSVEPNQTVLLSLADTSQALVDHCEGGRSAAARGTPEDPGFCGQTNACQTGLCSSELWLCVAQTALEMSQNPGSVVLTDSLGQPRYRGQDHDTESEVGLAHTAQLASAKSIAATGEALLDGACDNSSSRGDVQTSWRVLDETQLPAVGTDEMHSTAERFTFTLAEALRIGEAAADHGTERMLALAERDRTRFADRGEAARVTWFDDSLSRVLAAQAQIGGTTYGTVQTPTLWRLKAGVYDDDALRAVGIGSVPPCGEGCRRALESLRRSGITYSSLVPTLPSGGPYDISASSSQLAMGALPGVITNLNERIGHDATVFGTSGVTTPEEFAGRINVSLAELLQAVEQMRYEDVVFSRPRGVTLASPIRIAPAASGMQQDRLWDPTTLSGPVGPPAMHYLTRARMRQAWTGTPPRPANGRSLRLPLLRPERAYLFAYARAVASEALALSYMHDAGQDAALALQSIVQQATAREAVDVEVCTESTGSEVRVRVFGPRNAERAQSSDYRLVHGTDGLRCAVQGSLAGQPCTDLLLHPLVEADDPWADVRGSTGETRLSRMYAVEFNLAEVTGEVFVVRLRQGATGGFGAYEAVGGFDADLQPNRCTTLPFDASTYQRAAEIFELNDGGRTGATSCAGVPGRLPLEDEIIDDGDGYEDSFRHHLRVAALAADHADRLGQDLITTGLEMDRESQRQIDEIQNLCGTHINLDPFAEGQITTGACDESMGMPCADSTHTCIDTSCIATDLLGAEDSAQRQALEDCLGTGEIEPFVALGGDVLCAWRHQVHKDQICRDSNAPCPTVRPSGSTCSVPPALAATHEPITIDRTLNLVRSVDPEGIDIPGLIIPGARCTADVLESLDTLRSSSTTMENRQTALAAVRDSAFFDYDNVRRVAGRIGWTGEPFDFSRITIDGGPMRDNDGQEIGTTGDAESGTNANGAWPCSASASSIETAPANPLRTSFTNCSTGSARSRMNWRLGRAAVVLTALTDLGLSNHRLPVFIRESSGNSATLTNFDTRPANLSGVEFDVASQGTMYGFDVSGNIYGANSATSQYLWHAAGNVRMAVDFDHATPWTGGEGTSYPLTVDTSAERPIAFLNLGYRVAGSSLLADKIARRLWEGVGQTNGGRLNFGTGFWDPVGIEDEDLAGLSPEERPAARGRLFRRALLRADTWDTPYLYHGRNGSAGSGGTDVSHLTHIFVDPAWNMGDAANWIHLFAGEEHEASPPHSGYGPYIARRDLLDAMELACYVSTLEPPPPEQVTDEDRPRITSVDDLRQVEHFAERVAQSFDALAAVQIVRDVPADLIERITLENVGNLNSAGAGSADRATGSYGRLESQFRQTLRTMGESPARIAALLRTLAMEIRVMEREQGIFERGIAMQFLQLTVEVLQTVSACLNATMGATGPQAAVEGKAGQAGAICAIQAAVAVIRSIMTGLAVENATAAHVNKVDQFAERVSAIYDALDSERTVFLNAIDGLQALSGQLRDMRGQARSALARAMFASSDAAGRQYATNTVMRRLYDINLQRYQDSLRAARRSGAVARFAVEQRFGVDLEAQQCAQLVDVPATWANDVCTATGVDYRELRDPDVDLDEAAVRQMFIGDYVRRLDQYVESYRFDFPYQDGNDLMVMSLRDDVVRAQSTCVAPVSNWLGSSNDLLVGTLPEEDGTPGELAGWRQHGCQEPAPYDSCMAISEVQGPRFDAPVGVVPSAVFSRSESQPPRGFAVRFAPRNPMTTYSGDYLDGASYSQALVLPAGLYRLSWYERRLTPDGGPVVDLQPVVGSLNNSTPIQDEPRTLADSWDRLFRIVTIPASRSGEEFHIGVFAEAVGATNEQSLEVAGLQLEPIGGTPTETAWVSAGLSGVNTGSHGPQLFAATTAPGYGYVDDCIEGSPDAFRGSWRYDCTMLCSGGFSGHCNADEEAQQFCYWELPFNLDEDRLLSRGGDFGGGFAFGNYNYRSGDIAVNVVGTGVRDCEGTNATACYATAGIPFSLMHTAPAASTLEGGSYSIRAHDGSLHPVDLFDGRIESARALAAERYLSNPLSSADASLINVRVLRPRPAARRAPCDGSPSARRARWRVAQSGRSGFAVGSVAA